MIQKPGSIRMEFECGSFTYLMVTNHIGRILYQREGADDWRDSEWAIRFAKDVSPYLKQKLIEARSQYIQLSTNQFDAPEGFDESSNPSVTE